MPTLTAPAHHVRIGHTEMHAPVPGWTPHASCCSALNTCGWSTDDAAHLRALAVGHAAAEGHRVLVDDIASWTVVEVTS